MQIGAQLTDGFVTARVVGEFSAGKTRLLSELFGQLIPEPLMPISSLEPQTRLQLEITYGDAPALSLVERAQDFEPARLVRQLDEFPDRQDLADLDPMRYRLRLAVSEPRLILHEGDGYGDDEKTPKRLFLIDTPGWSSGDDELAEQEASALMTGYDNLALVYVSQAGRLDGVVNADHLRDFMSAVADADFVDQIQLLLVITRCPSADAPRMEKRARDLVHRLWAELGRDEDELSLDVFCVDFHAMSAQALQQFRDGFWRSLLEPLKQPVQPVGHSHPWVAALRRWPDDWDLRPNLRATTELLERAKTLLQQARQGDEFVAGMNMYRLTGLDKTALRKKVETAWFKQFGCDSVELSQWSVPALSDQHPLSDWWSNYWQRQLERTLEPVQAFFDSAREAINRLTPDVEDLKDYLLSQLDRPHARALTALDGSFASLVKTAHSLLKEPAAEKLVATLLALSQLQARYEDYYAQHAG